ncbi:excalibur calcium-binding domain-containing protein [Nocardia altamirensis]|uniref:excalibur calcium-binding domain-containing protein n=1 Tax=Nocardia altamirensis TaxID=472158 RepID=UPI000B071085|nr:excalibur calcium-binding domain-containing protein [Nocardia altamirensis]
MSISLFRRVTPAIGAACLVVGALSVVAPTATADIPTAVAVSARPDSIPPSNSEDGKKDKKKRKFYTDCDQVRAETGGPLRFGQPGFNSFLDKNNDGVACNEF